MGHSTKIPFQQTGFFSKTMHHYLEENEAIQPYYNNFSNIEGFQKQLEEKQNSFSITNRRVLAKAIQNQYKNVVTSELTTNNIKLLEQENTFTVTTGHQLNLFTGPLYFLYKIFSTINLCEKLRDEFPYHNFVPIYWMATEDHDFEEINYFNFDGKKVQWNSNQTGAVGRFSTKGLDQVFNVFSEHLGNSKNASTLKELFTEGYLKHKDLASATRYIANELFKTYGLVIVDGDDKELKELFSPFVKQELLEGISYKEVTNTNAKLEESYNIQVNPREINLFYLGDDFRERIIKKDGKYFVNNTELQFTEEEILSELENNPKAFSPNVIMRPLYQEVILPNLCYIGGGGELAYWLQLKDYFRKVEVPFPILLLRNSVQLITKKQLGKLEKLNIALKDIFKNQDELLFEKVTENSSISISFEDKKQFLQNHFKELEKVAEQTDKSFIGAVKAQERKQIKGLENLKKRLLKAEKKRQHDLVERIISIQNELLPNQSLEERQRNFSEFYLAYGEEFMYKLKKELNPLALQFLILEL